MQEEGIGQNSAGPQTLKDGQGNDTEKDDKARHGVTNRRTSILLSHQSPRFQINCNICYNAESTRN